MATHSITVKYWNSSSSEKKCLSYIDMMPQIERELCSSNQRFAYKLVDRLRPNQKWLEIPWRVVTLCETLKACGCCNFRKQQTRRGKHKILLLFRVRMRLYEDIDSTVSVLALQQSPSPIFPFYWAFKYFKDVLFVWSHFVGLVS